MTRAARFVPRALLAALAAALLLGCASRGGPVADLRRQAPTAGNAAWSEIRQLRRALASDPSDTEARLRLADLLVETGDLGSAERNYRQVLEREPDNVRAVNNLSDLYSRTGKHLEWAVEKMKPLAESDSVHRHVYLDTLGLLYFRMRRWGDARDAFRQASDLCRRGEVASYREECRLIEEHLSAARARTREAEPPSEP
jgi:Flp pilus assembly protein TadD